VALPGFSWPAALTLCPNSVPSLCADTMSCIKEGKSMAALVTATEALKDQYMLLWLSAGDPPLHV